MPRRKKPTPKSQARTRTIPGNPYQATLVRLHENWYPEQVAAAITECDNQTFSLSRRLVLILSEMPQRVPVRIPEFAGGGEPQSNVTPANLGKCQVCHTLDAVIITEHPAGSGKVVKTCVIDAPKAEEEDAESAGA